jgi:hypothetical protein
MRLIVEYYMSLALQLWRCTRQYIYTAAPHVLMSDISLGVTAPVATSRAVHMNPPSMGADVAQVLQPEVRILTTMFLSPCTDLSRWVQIFS